MKQAVISTSGLPGSADGRKVGQTHDAKLKDAAQKFEAAFMTEMIRLARPSAQAAGPFASGKSEETWRYFMDQALGQATVDGPGGDNGLRQSIEKALRAAERHS
jgi:Rod binding domain-containing protein